MRTGRTSGEPPLIADMREHRLFGFRHGAVGLRYRVTDLQEVLAKTGIAHIRENAADQDGMKAAGAVPTRCPRTRTVPARGLRGRPASATGRVAGARRCPAARGHSTRHGRRLRRQARSGRRRARQRAGCWLGNNALEFLSIENFRQPRLVTAAPVSAAACAGRLVFVWRGTGVFLRPAAGRAFQELVEFPTIQPHAATTWAEVDLHLLTLREDQASCGASGAVHRCSVVHDGTHSSDRCVP